MKCKYFLDFSYCKFESFCKFSHEPNQEQKSIEIIKKELNDVKKEIKQKEVEIEKLNEKIKKVENNTKSEMLIVEKKYEARENEMKALKEENKIIKSCYEVLGKEVKALKAEFENGKNVLIQENDEIVEVEEIRKPEREFITACDKCEFLGKSESGLKTHGTVKHNKSSII